MLCRGFSDEAGCFNLQLALFTRKYKQLVLALPRLYPEYGIEAGALFASHALRSKIHFTFMDGVVSLVEMVSWLNIVDTKE